MEVNFSQRLKDIRILHNYTQQDVAAGIDIKRPTYQAYEENRSIPPIHIVLKLGMFYGYGSLDEFIGLTAERNQKSRLEKAYYSAPIDKRNIVDFILNINAK